MNSLDLVKEIKTELEYLDITIKDIVDINILIDKNLPNKTQLAAIVLYIAQFYNGFENILKRICKYYKITLPYGGDSHIALTNMFNNNATKPLPILIDDSIINDISSIRKFRHFVIHGYAFQIEWKQIKSSVERIDSIYHHFKNNVSEFILSL